MKFEELNIHPLILKSLIEEGYEVPSPIQEQAIPAALAGKDILGCAQTGTGKTAAFAVPILQRLLENKLAGSAKVIQVLILTPTRELAVQIYESFKTYGKYTSFRSTCIYGGVNQTSQVSSLRRGVDIVIATPGRLMDLVGQKHINLSFINTLVLDEADRMLDMGFSKEVKRIIKLLPEKRQNLLFSATMPQEIIELVNTILIDPVKIEVTPVSSTVDLIQQSLYYVDKENKGRLLIKLIQEKNMDTVLVFTRTKHGADKVVRELTAAKIPALAIHGNKSQNARQNALNAFKTRQIRALIATDIAARGIDIDHLDFVINYNIPEISETYVHRIGRTGRAGRDGTSISFCEFSEINDLKAIEKLIQQKLPVVNNHPYPLVNQTISDPKTAKSKRKPSSQSSPKSVSKDKNIPLENKKSEAEKKRIRDLSFQQKNNKFDNKSGNSNKSFHRNSNRGK